MGTKILIHCGFPYTILIRATELIVFRYICLYNISTLFKFQPLLSYIKEIANLDLNVFLESDHMGHLNHDSGNMASGAEFFGMGFFIFQLS